MTGFYPTASLGSKRAAVADSGYRRYRLLAGVGSPLSASTRLGLEARTRVVSSGVVERREVGMTALVRTRLGNIVALAAFGAVSCGLGMAARAADAGRVVASAEKDWPQWRGPTRDGICREKGLLQQWPEGGPKLLWSAGGLGKGYGSPIIVGDTIYVTGDVGKEFVVFALGQGGSVKWRTVNGEAWLKSVPGGRATCCYDEGQIYVMNAHGRLVRLDAASGTETWAVDVLETFEGKNITWGISESVLVEGGSVFVTPVGTKALMAALDKRTGETLWTTDPIPGEQVTYSSPILVNLQGRKQLISCGAKFAFAVDAGSGELLWKHPHALSSAICGSPVYHRGAVYISNGSKDVGKVYCLKITGPEPQMAWSCDLGNTYAGNVVCVDGTVLGSKKREPGKKGWQWLDAETGAIRHADNEMHSGSVLYADGRFYCLTDHGVISLHKPAGKALETVGKVEVVTGKKDVWAHPVICNGLLYIRFHDTLYCYDIRRG